MVYNYQVVFSGGQGCGKTVLAHYVSKQLGIPYIGVETRKYMPDGIKSHLDVIKLSVNDPQKAIDFQTKLIEDRAELFEKWKYKSYVSDRAVVDSFVYYLMHNSMFDTLEHTDYLYNLTVKSIENVGLTYIFRNDHLVVEDDNVRITSPYYQRAYGVLLNSVFGEMFARLNYKAWMFKDKTESTLTINTVFDTAENIVKGLFLIETGERASVQTRYNILLEALNANFNAFTESLGVPYALS